MPENEKRAAGLLSNAGFIAWGSYGVLIIAGHPTAAVCVGLAIMIALVTLEYRDSTLKIVDCTSLGCFALALLTIVTTGRDLFSNYRFIAAWGIFAVVAWATLLARFPFTLQYARERAPREVWSTPPFITMNVVMTAVWALIFTLDTLLAILARRGHSVLMLVGVIPAVTMLIGYAFNRYYPEHFRKRFDLPSANHSAALSSQL
jgi:hypothetical protein